MQTFTAVFQHDNNTSTVSSLIELNTLHESTIQIKKSIESNHIEWKIE